MIATVFTNLISSLASISPEEASKVSVEIMQEKELLSKLLELVDMHMSQGLEFIVNLIVS